jgi:hypothetical protein
MAHWVYILSAATGPLGLAAWRYAPRAFLMLMGGLTTNPQRSKQCAEMLRLQRKDAKDLQSYLVDAPEGSLPSAATPPDQGGSSTTTTLGAVPDRHVHAG